MSQGRVHQLIYTSAAAQRMTDQGLSSLLLTARTKNKRRDVSGILLYHEGSFLQVIEGDPVVVEALFAHIERDKRHHRATVLSRQSIPTRNFGDWSMGFVSPDARLVREVPGFNDFFRDGFDRTRLADTAGRAHQLIGAFASGRFRQNVAF